MNSGMSKSISGFRAADVLRDSTQLQPGILSARPLNRDCRGCLSKRNGKIYLSEYSTR